MLLAATSRYRLRRHANTSRIFAPVPSYEPPPLLITQLWAGCDELEGKDWAVSARRRRPPLRARGGTHCRDEATAIPGEELFRKIGPELWVSALSFGCEQPRHDHAGRHLVERADRQELGQQRRQY